MCLVLETLLQIDVDSSEAMGSSRCQGVRNGVVKSAENREPRK